MLLGQVVLLLISYRIAICLQCNFNPCGCCENDICTNSGRCAYGCKAGYWGERCYNACPNNCLTCSGNLYCSICVDGYYKGLDSSMRQRNDCSLKCSNGCKRCHSIYCSECSEGYYLTNGLCSKCDKTCKSCTTLTHCLACNDGYFLDRSSCKNCIHPCKTCSSSTECTSCSNGWYLSYKYCQSCSSQCISCSRNDDCNECFEGHYLDNDSCKTCSDHCKYCDASAVCTECQEGYFLQNAKCYVCGNNCIECNGPYNCSKCKTGYYVYFGQCFKCRSQCLSCVSSQSCNSCNEGYFVGYGLCLQCMSGCKLCTWYNNCKRCNTGYYLHDSYCYKCTANCSSCLSYSNCRRCQSSYYLEQNYQHNICKRCPNNCDSCISRHYCTKCKVGYTGPVCSGTCSDCKIGTACDQYTGHCRDGCEEGYTGASCDSKCNSFCKSCSKLDAQKCFECVDNRYGKISGFYSCTTICPDKCLKRTCDDDTGFCLHGCQYGFWGTTCSASCSDNCFEGKCLAENGFCTRGCINEFKGDQCNCPPNCNCNNDEVCHTCRHGFEVTQKNCECITCINSMCTSCTNASYYLVDNYCCPCSQNCKTNECISDSECLGGCKIGYYKNNCSKLCIGNDEHCLECLTNANNDYGGCFRCHKNYYPSMENKLCRECSRTCRNGTCDSRNGNCSAGCEDGWWGHTCERNCDPGCLICVQSEGKCSVCADDKYLHDCSSTCSKTCNITDGKPRCEIMDGSCIFGCVNRTFYGTQCEKKCSSTCKDQICHRENGTCLKGCSDNYFGPQCKSKCKDTCFLSKDGKLCHEANGTCLSTCHNGYHGYMCGLTCSQTCANRTCERLTGACVHGCDSGFEGPRCEKASKLTSDVTKSYLTIGTLIGVTFLVVFIVGAIVGVLLIKRRRNKRNRHDETISNTTVVTYSDILLRESQVEQHDAVYAVPNKLNKKAAEQPKTSDKTNNDYEGCTDAVNQGNNANFHNVKSVVTPDCEGVISKENGAESTRCDSYETINRMHNKKSLVDQKPGVVYENTKVTRSIYRNSEAQVKSNRSAYSCLEIDEEDIQEDTLIRDDEFDYAYYNVAAVKKRRVTLNELSQYVSTKTTEDFINEFDELPAGLIKPYTESQKRENIKKNRYKGIYPYDHSRVILNDGDFDYINASYIDGYNVRKAYIASIGPTYRFMGDMSPFWRMIWQEKAGTIVMLTSLSEGGEPKCDQYWPEKDCSQMFTNIRVTTDREEINADYSIRSITLQKNSEVRRIVHAHFTAWPDKGTPDDVTSLIEFRHKVNSLTTDLEGPIVVHCSAGIGRTGTYISVDSLVHEGKAEGGVDIFACVRNLREHRVNMVQTVGQYQYVHYTLVHVLTFSCKPVKALNFHEYMSTNTTEHLENQFQHLQDSIEARTVEETEAVRLNKRLTDKNRHGADIPGDINRPRLQLQRQNGRAAYINALFINSFRTKKRFLIAQSPLPSTMEDFLTLIVQEHVSYIVSMEPSLNGNIAVGAYYPVDNKPLKVGSCTVHSEKAECTDHYVMRTLKIIHQGKSKTQEVTVTHIQFTKWIEKQKTPDDPKMFMRFVRDVELKCDSDNRERPILVHCLTGAEKSGLFCVVSILLEKIQLEQEISVVNTVRQVKHRRHMSIPNKEQYMFCHQCLDEYLHTFDTYSNFCLET